MSYFSARARACVAVRRYGCVWVCVLGCVWVCEIGAPGLLSTHPSPVARVGVRGCVTVPFVGARAAFPVRKGCVVRVWLGASVRAGVRACVAGYLRVWWRVVGKWRNAPPRNCK